ncbi:caspase recruitment domain-containing protein 19-like isoform X1 [Osmerus eperlanus]|uniref:caspase recruitment domain-containing protein 19-like isoform X1 n=2 Tax=Osmerus eperlanus TaxID=29151 RepID=UPI002E165123
MELADGYHEQLQRDSQSLCSDQRMDTELVDKLVLQLNRIYPQILSDKEAQRFRNLRVPTTVRLAELLVHLQGKGEEACHEFYRGLHIHAEDIYFSLPTRVRRRETADPIWTNTGAGRRERYVLNDRGPLFFLSCFSLAVGLAMLYYCGAEVKAMKGPGSLLQYSALRLSRGASDVLISYADDGARKI